jgi:hypothetical protein
MNTGADGADVVSTYYLADEIRSIISLSNSAGVLVNTYTYDSFGKLTNTTGTITLERTMGIPISFY